MRARAKGRKKGMSAAVRKSGPGRSRPVTPSRNKSPHPAELPKTYGDTKVVLACIDPHLVHVYWEVLLADVKKAVRSLRSRGREAAPVLRFYDVTSPEDAGIKPTGTFDISVDLSAGKWYVPLWSPDKEYFVELGLTTPQGDFRPLARSNTEVVPPSEPSEVNSVSYMHVAPAETDSQDAAPLSFAIHELPQTLPPTPEGAGPLLPDAGMPAEIPSAAGSEVETVLHSDHTVRGQEDDLATDADRSFSAGLPSSSL